MQIIRLAEWSSTRADLCLETRRALAEAAAHWQMAHRLTALPLQWGGADGCTLSARQWIGVLEVEEARVEIYPKLDKALLAGAAPDQALADSTLSALLPMLEAAQFGEWVETGDAALGETELSFIDVWALLLGRHLSTELRRGVVSQYQHRRDDLAGVRGKIAISRQVGALFNRMDVIACEWDEFCADTPFNRLLKCACVELKKRARSPVARGLLGDCAFMLQEAADVAPVVALRQTQRLIWTRATERYRPSFELARRLLRDLSPELEGGDANSWAFLVDMNAVFEGFCRAALEAKFGVAVQEQVHIGHLLRAPRNAIVQKPDFVWNVGGQHWIGDAKWKMLGEVAGAISPADARQLAVYALMSAQHNPLPATALLYPTLGHDRAQKFELWNGTSLHLWPVRVRGAASLGEAISG